MGDVANGISLPGATMMRPPARLGASHGGDRTFVSSPEFDRQRRSLGNAGLPE